MGAYHLIFHAACVLHNVCADLKVPPPGEAAIQEAIDMDAQKIHNKRAAKEQARVVFAKVGGSLKEGKEKRNHFFTTYFT